MGVAPNQMITSSLASQSPPGGVLELRTSEFRRLREGRRSCSPLVDILKLLAAVAVRVGWEPGEIRSNMFRHTYCAARLQTLD